MSGLWGLMFNTVTAKFCSSAGHFDLPRDAFVFVGWHVLSVRERITEKIVQH